MQALRSTRVHGAAAAPVRREMRNAVVVARSAPKTVEPVAVHAPPTVAETRRKFIEGYRRPIPAVYNTVVQELLVQQHFIRWGSGYKYNEVLALGFVSAFDQLLDSFEPAERTKVFDAYVTALGEDPEQYRADAARLEAAAKALPGPDSLSPDAAGGELQQVLARVAAAAAGGTAANNKLFAIGLFRLLELTGAKDPATLERLAKAVNAKPESVNKDLTLYRGILARLSVAKELMKEFLEREKKKQAERAAAKAPTLAAA